MPVAAGEPALAQDSLMDTLNERHVKYDENIGRDN